MITVKPARSKNTISDLTNDIVICNIPWADLSAPLLAPAILKGIAESQGYKAKTIDFNIDLYKNFCGKDEKKWGEIEKYFASYTDYRPDVIKDFYEHVIETLSKLNFKYLGISVFYIFTQKATWELCHLIREKMPKVKIVLGGKGLNVYSHQSLHPYLNDREKSMTFNKLLAIKKLADYFIIGDAEDAILELLSGKLDFDLDTNQISDWYVPKKDNLTYPFANFDDYDLSEYKGIAGRLQIPIISSKGCVRACDFCDVPSQFKKFQSKDGKRMAEEVLFLSKKYNNYEFAMADSIANGNLKSLKEFANIIAQHNKNVEDSEKIKWSGNWIHRPIGQLTEEVFSKIAESGAIHFTVGAEHFSDSVLSAMNKKTNNAGLFHELELFEKYNVQCDLNNIIAHWSESYEAFMEHIESAIKLGPYFANNTIIKLKAGIFRIMKNTPAQKNKNAELVSSKDDFSLSWYNKKNPSLTLKARLARFYFFIRICKYFNIPIVENDITIINYVHRIKDMLDETMKLFEEHVDRKNLIPCPIFKMLPQIEKYADTKTKELFPGSELILKFTANSCKGDPGIVIRVNNEVKYDSLVRGYNEIKIPFSYDYENENKIEIGMYNKNKNDTIVDKQGKILQDKNIIMHAVKLDKVNIIEYPDYYNNNVIYTTQNEKINPLYGFWANGSLNISFKAPFWKHFQIKKHTNTTTQQNAYQQAFSAFENLMEQIEY